MKVCICLNLEHVRFGVPAVYIMIIYSTYSEVTWEATLKASSFFPWIPSHFKEFEVHVFLLHWKGVHPIIFHGNI